MKCRTCIISQDSCNGCCCGLMKVGDDITGGDGTELYGSSGNE